MTVGGRRRRASFGGRGLPRTVRDLAVDVQLVLAARVEARLELGRAVGEVPEEDDLVVVDVLVDLLVGVDARHLPDVRDVQRHVLGEAHVFELRVTLQVHVEGRRRQAQDQEVEHPIAARELGRGLDHAAEDVTPKPGHEERAACRKAFKVHFSGVPA